MAVILFFCDSFCLCALVANFPYCHKDTIPKAFGTKVHKGDIKKTKVINLKL